MTEYYDLLPIIIEQESAVLPDGYDSWAIKSVHPDLQTRNGFQWAYPGGVSRSDDSLDRANVFECPSHRGDGLCVATSWWGMSSSLIPARTLLLVAYRSADVLGRDDIRGKLRVAGHVHVVALIDGERLIHEHGAGANLHGAYLPGADLAGVNLVGANLSRANLAGADLSGANLIGADLYGANLSGADLLGAELVRANLTRADLSRANLVWVDLSGANLTGADLTGAPLAEARGLNLPFGWTLTDTDMAVLS